MYRQRLRTADARREVACGEVGVKLISPFVGRIYDWHKRAAGAASDEAAMAAQRPGRPFGCAIYTYYKRYGIETKIIGRELRNVGQFRARGLRSVDDQPGVAGAIASLDGRTASRARSGCRQDGHGQRRHVDGPASAGP